MGLETWAEFASRHRRVVVLLGLLSTFAGADLAINRPKETILGWLAVPFLAAGAAMFTWAIWPQGIRAQPTTPSLASALLDVLAAKGRLIRYFPVLGATVVVADIAYNLTLSATPALLTEDTIVLLAGTALIGYGFVPARFARERDFVLVFFLALNAILVLPLLAARAVYTDFERSVDIYSWFALVHQSSAVLSLLGVSNTVHPVAGATAPGLTFYPLHLSGPVTVVITAACSGIYTFGIFAAAFVAFVLSEYDKPTRRIWILMALGFLTAYVANVLRMVVIVLVGYYLDTQETELQNMLLAHSYAGWLIFLGWIALFWTILVKSFPTRHVDSARLRTPRRQAACSLCDGALSPAIPAARCACGGYYHSACVAANVRCPFCGRRTTGEGIQHAEIT